MIFLACPYCGSDNLFQSTRDMSEFKCHDCHQSVPLYEVNWMQTQPVEPEESTKDPIEE